MKKKVRIIALMLCLAAALFALSSCGNRDQSKSPLIGTWIAQEEGQSDMTFNADGTGYLQNGEKSVKFTFTDKGDGSYEMTAEKATPITQKYRIEGDNLITTSDIGIEETFTRKK